MDCFGVSIGGEGGKGFRSSDYIGHIIDKKEPPTHPRIVSKKTIMP